MELNIKVKLDALSDVDDLLALIKNMEKEYSCNCTLLEVEINHLESYLPMKK